MEYTLMGFVETDDIDNLKKEFENEINESDIFTPNGSLLHWCSEYNSLKCMEFLLTKENILKKIDYVDKQQGASAFHWAAGQGNTECLKLLLSNGANLNQKDHGEENALHWAALNGKPDSLKFLIDSNSDLNAQSKETKYTALHYTALNQHTECAALLINAKCDVDIKDNEGLLAADLANETKNQKLIDHFNPEKINFFVEITELKDDNNKLKSQLEQKNKECDELRNKMESFLKQYTSLEKSDLKKNQEYVELENEFKEYREKAEKETHENKETLVQLQSAFETITNEIISISGKLEEKNKECEELKDQNRQQVYHIKILKEQISELQEKALTPQIVELPVNLMGKIIIPEFEISTFKNTYKQLDEIISFTTRALNDSKKNFDHFLEVVEKSKSEQEKATEKIENNDK